MRILGFTFFLFTTAILLAGFDKQRFNGDNGQNWDDLKSSILASEKIIPEDGDEFDLFGISVNISGNRALIGSYRDDDNGLSSGSAYVFEFDGASWIQTAKLKPNDGEEGDVFGYSVSIDGDRALIGAFLDDDSGSASGSAYIFDYNGNNWVQSAKLTSLDLEDEDWFGSAVSLSGDWALVGAENDDDKGEDAGAAYLFKFDGLTWYEYTKLTGGDITQADNFAGSLSLLENRALIGSKYGNGNNTISGAAYVFDFDGANWIEKTKLSHEGGMPGDQFGFSVSLSENRALIGANRTDNEFYSSTGSAYIFDFDGTNWTQSAKLSIDDSYSGDRFGYAVSLNSDRALIGAPYEDDKGGDSGSVYIFGFDGENWSQSSQLNLGDADVNDRFGYSVSLSSDDALISAYRDDDSGTDSGSVCVISMATIGHICGDLIFKDGLEIP